MNAQQHLSHQNLLTEVPTGASHAALDAIIVPTARPVDSLRPAFAVAKALDVPLLLLCSLNARAGDAAREAGKAGVRATTIDITDLPGNLVPDFDTDRQLQSGPFHRNVDTSLKRNFGLLVAAAAGWRRILFLDDDIVLPDPSDLTTAAGLLDRYAVVGLRNAGMPDNSVVCHALRHVGVPQDTFVGGGALVVEKEAFHSFFPNIYNEDWFFLLDGRKLRSTAVTGSAIQRPYDPYAEPARAASEELGDVLAEGVFGLLDTGCGPADADDAYWERFLLSRQEVIHAAIRGVPHSTGDPERQARMIAALGAALDRSALITPGMCVQYLHAWAKDCARWSEHIAGLRGERRGLGGALEELGLGTVAHPRVKVASTRRGTTTPIVAPAPAVRGSSPGRDTLPALREPRPRVGASGRSR